MTNKFWDLGFKTFYNRNLFWYRRITTVPKNYDGRKLVCLSLSVTSDKAKYLWVRIGVGCCDKFYFTSKF
jgi:hypothetical protein